MNLKINTHRFRVTGYLGGIQITEYFKGYEEEKAAAFLKTLSGQKSLVKVPKPKAKMRNATISNYY